MPRTLISESPRKVFASCLDAWCDGYQSEEVDGLAREVGDTFASGGGDIPGIERSQIEYLVTDPADGVCPVCSGPRVIAGEPRPVYDPMSGHDPMGLVKGAKFDAGVVNTEADEAQAAEMAEMRKEMAEMRAERQKQADA